MKTDIAAFIDSAELADLPPAGGTGLAAPPVLTGNGEEAAVVDSNIVTYRRNVPLGLRNDVANWLFLAQRVATKQVLPTDTEVWTSAYYQTLLNLGWTVRGELGAWHKESVVNSEVHENILRVAAVLLGPGSAALAVITAAVTALGDMDKGSKWITLFDRRGESAEAVGFQVADVTPAGEGGASLEGIDFRFIAHTTMTQVLFFKFHSDRAELHRRRVVLDISEEIITRYGPQVREKVQSKIDDNLAAIEL